MVHDGGSSSRDLKPVTVRLRLPDYLLLKEHADARNTSLNAIVSEAVAQYGARIKRDQAIAQIQAFQQRLHSRREMGTDSVGLLREVREGRARGCAPDEPAFAGPETMEATPADRTGGRAR
ncbi:MAG: hypothetical protein Q8P31_01595 [Bacillota bacterium]|nr:hypothetical protein [Bacillota bacterium]